MCQVLSRNFILSAIFCSYMITEQYEEAVRDYEKIVQMDGSSGNKWHFLSFSEFLDYLFILF